MSQHSGMISKRSRPVPSDFEQTISDITLLAKRRAISLLDICLNNHHLNASEQRDLILDVTKAFGLPVGKYDPSNDSHEVSRENNTQVDKQRISSRICTGSTKEPVNRKKDDDHNEVCEVCEKGGDLLCCDTCTLVFHLGCIRPKISTIPKGKWSCAHCISDGVGAGDSSGAKKALAMMGRLSRGLDSEDEDDDSIVHAKNNKIGDIVIIRSGKRFIVRKLAHSQIVELGRYDNLDDALGSIKPVYKKVLTVSSGLAAGGEGALVTTPIGAVEDDDLWCTHCMDDPAVAVCAFCGCRTCFGKHNSEYLLLCDYCDQESHTYCLTPQLVEIPEEAWYCSSCINQGYVKTEVTAPAAETSTSTSTSSSSSILTSTEDSHDSSSAIVSLEGIVHPTHRIKGRPGRPKKVFPPLCPTVEICPLVLRPTKVAGRGRGRPPGSRRIVGPEIPGHLYPYSTKLKHKPLSAASDDMHDYTTFGGYCPQLHINSSHSTLVPGAGVEAVLALLNNCAGKRPFWPAEKLVINQFREWSPLEDLEAVHSAMVAQKELLLQRIRCLNPLFTEPLSAVRPPRNVVSTESDNPSNSDSGSIKATALPAIIPFVTAHGNLSINPDLPDMFLEGSHSEMDLDPASGEAVPPEEVDLRDGETMYVVFEDDLLDGDGDGDGDADGRGGGKDVRQGVVNAEDDQREGEGDYYDLDGNENGTESSSGLFDGKDRKSNVNRAVGKTESRDELEGETVDGEEEGEGGDEESEGAGEDEVLGVEDGEGDGGNDEGEDVDGSHIDVDEDD